MDARSAGSIVLYDCRLENSEVDAGQATLLGDPRFLRGIERAMASEEAIVVIRRMATTARQTVGA